MKFSRRRKLILLERILSWSKRNENGCLICFLNHNHNGYSRINVKNNKKLFVHRLIMHLVKDFNLDSPYRILHNDDVCSDKACIEVDHLRVGTMAENNQDILKKQCKGQDSDSVYCRNGHELTEFSITSTGRCKTCLDLWWENRKIENVKMKNKKKEIQNA